MTAIGTGDSEVALRAQLERTERQASARQRQLERYAADLREVFKQERNRALELRDSYRATVQALSNAVEARDAYTGKHAERVTAYGIALARATGLDTDLAPGIEFGFLLHDVGKVAVPDAILFKPARARRGRVRPDRPAPGGRLGHPARRRLPRRGQAGGAPPPRALGRQRLPGPAGGRGDPARGARVRGRRRARRAHHRPPVPPRHALLRARARRSAPTPARSSTPPSSTPWTRSRTRAFAALRDGVA